MITEVAARLFGRAFAQYAIDHALKVGVKVAPGMDLVAAEETKHYAAVCNELEPLEESPAYLAMRDEMYHVYLPQWCKDHPDAGPPRLTFEQFLAKGQPCPNLGQTLDMEHLDNQPGVLYPGNLWVEDATYHEELLLPGELPPHRWLVELPGECHADNDLAKVAHTLYLFGVESGVIRSPLPPGPAAEVKTWPVVVPAPSEPEELPLNHHYVTIERHGVKAKAIAVTANNMILGPGDRWRRGVLSVDVVEPGLAHLSEFERECIAYAINEGGEFEGKLRSELKDDSDEGPVVGSWKVDDVDRLKADMES